MLQNIPVWAFLLAATIVEASGDAIIRVGLYNRAGIGRLAAMLAGAVLLFGYGVILNLAPLPFSRVVGLYIATLFVVWQVVNFITFRSAPSFPILLGGILIIIGGLIITFWNPLTENQ